MMTFAYCSSYLASTPNFATEHISLDDFNFTSGVNGQKNDYVLWSTDPCNIGEGDLFLKEGVEGQLRLLELLLLLPDPALLNLHHATHTHTNTSQSCHL